MDVAPETLGALGLPILRAVKVPQLDSPNCLQALLLDADTAGTGVPATKRVEPLIAPIVAPATATTVPNVGGVGGEANTPLKSMDTTLADVPPHSAPQFKMNAWVSLVLKTAEKG